MTSCDVSSGPAQAPGQPLMAAPGEEGGLLAAQPNDLNNNVVLCRVQACFAIRNLALPTPNKMIIVQQVTILV